MSTVDTPDTQNTERDVSLEEAMGGTDQAPQADAPSQQPEDPKETLDSLRPMSDVRIWTIGPEGIEREYIQRPLSFVQKMQWFALVGKVLDKAMSGEGALSMNNLLSAPEGRPRQLTLADFRDADLFVQAIGKLLVYAPDFLTDSFCIWLSVPDYEREVAKDLMQRSEDEGGLSDEAGIEIIETFIDQNYEALDRFFRDLVARLSERIAARAKEATTASQRSKR